MKVCYIFREKERNAHSIELLFDVISAEVENSGIEVQKWYKPLSNMKALFALRKLKADIYHITGDCYFLSLFLPWKHTVMTVHDIGMYKNHPKTLKRRLFVLLSFILPMKCLRAATVISDLTKSDLVNMLNIRSEKLCVIHNPLVRNITYRPKNFNELKPRIMQIGSGDHKNLIGLIEAVKGISCMLDIVGTPSAKLEKKMKEYHIDYVVSSNLSDEDVLKKYQDCDMLYFASLSEGFGLPILEAQAMGRPVITSDEEPTKTVCGGGALLVNPRDYIAMRDAIQSLIRNNSLRNQLIIRGLENVKKFSKESVVSQYIDIYNKLVKS